jgi:hypothetical protein
MVRCAISLTLLAIAIGPAEAYGQGKPSIDDPADASVKWETTCAARGCLLEADVLRGDSGDPPDKSDFHEYIGIEVAFDRNTQKPAYFAFHVDANAERDAGISIAFTKTAKSGDSGKSTIDSDGTSKLEISDCDDKSCVVRVPLGLVKKTKDSRNLILLDKFLKSDHVVLLYMRGGKQYRTIVALSSFQKEYERVMTTAFGAPVVKK